MHWARRAASRAAWTAGSKSAINTAIIAITTSNSMSVNRAKTSAPCDLEQTETYQLEVRSY